MAAFVKFESFSEGLAKKEHNLHADTLKVYLSNTAPNVATMVNKADLAEIAAGNNPGGAGGDTTFGASLVVAKGGSGGLGDSVTTIHAGGNGGAGGLASTSVGDFKSTGQAGGAGVSLAAAQAISGNGGASVYGGGALGVKNATSAGTTATGNGGGGSGGCIVSGGASVQGGSGGPGLIIVTEYR